MGRVVIGVDLGGTNMRTAVLDPGGRILAKHKEATNAETGWQHVVAKLVEKIRQQGSEARQQGDDVVAVGVGVPGVIALAKGVVVKSPNLPDWSDLPLKEKLESALSLPVYLENDANASALGEHWRGAGRGISSMILVTLGTGVGGGIIIDERIWHGADGMAGEIGHLTLLPDGRPCGCGNQGCLEMYASARGIVMSYREARERSGDLRAAEAAGMTAQEVYEAARCGNAAASGVMRDMGRYLGIGLASLINIFNPEAIIIGGGLSNIGDRLLKPAYQEAGRRAYRQPFQAVRFARAELGRDSGVLGAAAFALEQLRNAGRHKQ